jgi:hypothetical protein
VPIVIVLARDLSPCRLPSAARTLLLSERRSPSVPPVRSTLCPVSSSCHPHGPPLPHSWKACASLLGFGSLTPGSRLFCECNKPGHSPWASSSFLIRHGTHLFCVIVFSRCGVIPEKYALLSEEAHRLALPLFSNGAPSARRLIVDSLCSSALEVSSPTGERDTSLEWMGGRGSG